MMHLGVQIRNKRQYDKTIISHTCKILTYSVQIA